MSASRAVRALTADDLAAYRTLHRHGLTHAPTSFVEALAHDDARGDAEVAALLERGEAWGVFSDGALVGKLVIDTLPYPGFTHTRWVHVVYVHPDARGTGAASALMRGAIEQAQQAGVIRVLLWVHGENPAARAFYEKLGFREAGRVPEGIAVAGRFADDVLMCLKLDPA